MGTKNNPGKFDCYANAHPDEPMFVLLGRDPMAGYLVRQWARHREAHGEEAAKVQEARTCADAIDVWALNHGKSPHSDPRDEQIRALREALSHIEDETVERIAAFAVGWDMPGFINGLRRGDWRKT